MSKRLMGQSGHKRSAYPLFAKRKAIAKAERAALDAMMDCWAHSLDPMPEFTPKMHECCAALAALRGDQK